MYGGRVLLICMYVGDDFIQGDIHIYIWGTYICMGDVFFRYWCIWGTFLQRVIYIYIYGGHTYIWGTYFFDMHVYGGRFCTR